MKRNHKPTKRSTNSAMQDARCMHVLSFLTQTSTKIWYTRTTGGTITYSPYTYTSRYYDQGFHSVLNVVSYLHKNTEYITTSRPFVPALTNGPHVSYATRVMHMQFSTFTHTLPSTIEMAPRRSTLNGQRCIRHNNVFTSRTLVLRDIQG